jgi:septal ring factor EnvC (AmiA/AmiB activator)
VRPIALLMLLPALVLAQDSSREQATEQQLDALREEIREVQQRIASQSTQRDELQQALRDAEIRIADNDRQLEKLQRQIDDVVAALETLEAEAKRLEQQRADLETQLIAEIRNLWALRQGGGLKVLLGDQGPDRTARNLAYYQRLLGARTESIAAYEALLADLERNRAARLTSQKTLVARRADLQQEQQKAAALQQERQITLAAIEKSLSRDSDRVAKLEADRERLSRLLDELRSSIAELDTPASYKPFVQAKGELQFPAKGRPSNRFGEQRNAGSLRWRGWLIPAREGSDVRAIHHGRVVYSDWLRGQGLLMILDHGDGWLSLYGHNRSLQAEVGDWVQPGEVIARVGASGGATMPALYFEIRKDGKPVDPGRWVTP